MRKPKPRGAGANSAVSAGECTATATDPDNCGECGAACDAVANGKAGCAGGRCGIENCDPGFANCSGSDATGCETNTRSDRAHCGGCNNECPPGQECRAGGCTCGADGACGAGETCCDGVCRHLETSFEACGGRAAECDDRQADQCTGGVCTCGNGAACPDGRTCQGGSCSCPSGQDVCADACVDRQVDESHCGQCGRACDAGQVCRSGLCGVTCGAGGFCSASGDTPVCCGGTCFSTASSSRHCGECGNDCSTQLTNFCIEGTCRCGFTGAPCGEGQTCCFGGDHGVGGTGICLSTSTDMDHCGICDLACGPGANRCVQGDCRCGDGAECGEPLTCCGNQACFDLRHDQNNCGACGNVCPGDGQSENSDVLCLIGECWLTCKGENYDMNFNAVDGCEVRDMQNNRTQATARNLGSITCFDFDRGQFSGSIYEDARAHNPEPPGFDHDHRGVNAAPLYYTGTAVGGLCENDPFIRLVMQGGTSGCYQLTLHLFGDATHTEITATVIDGEAVIQRGSGTYDDGDAFLFVVEKICQGPPEVATFLAEFHL